MVCLTSLKDVRKVDESCTTMRFLCLIFLVLCPIFVDKCMYYKHLYKSRNDLVSALERYLHYYNFERLQRHLSIMTPQEYHNHYLAA